MLVLKFIDHSAHMTMIDQPEKLKETIGNFLHNVENNK